MLTQEQFHRIARIIPFLQPTDSRLAQEFRRAAYHVRIPQGREIFSEGDYVEGIALLMSGVVRVYKISESGREITLYRFGEGESCIITATAILNAQDFPAIAIVEKEAEAVMIPTQAFTSWVQLYDPWRNFVFGMVSQRLASVIEIVDEVAFQRMDRRIASLLLERSKFRNPIRITHQEIANELGSSREVISRLLEDFARREILGLARGQIEVLDSQALQAQVVW